ncbi:TPA: hypothetical protein N0F65_006398 [Lagenidium giganteum]|uniref:Uncharacterized protein n=1 Tax=Lagenidium giganteum TaxID=4803 RepID=A0AAV2YL73_9STRA|nr:TPA: hypothetical protein N0F65_006398 [Lagenidium giganteum]
MMATRKRDPAALPAPVFDVVLAFAVYDATEALIPSKKPFPDRELRQLASVSRRWATPIGNIISVGTKRSLEFTLQDAGADEIKRLSNALSMRGAALRDLELVMGMVAYNRQHFIRNHGLHDVDGTAIDWDAMFARVPHLVRLDLSRTPLCSVRLPRILRAASTFCPDVKALILPVKETEDVLAESAQPLFTALYEALRTWYQAQHRVASRGLLQLTVPSRIEVTPCEQADAFLSEVAMWCPNLEYLDGYKVQLDQMDRITCHDRFFVRADAFERFCAGCPELREWDWVAWPLTDEFFAIFGKYPKPKLSKLVIEVNMLWKWESYWFETTNTVLPTARDGTVAHPEGSGTNARAAWKTLQACPNLKALEVALYHPLTDAQVEDIFDEDDEFLAFVYPQQEMMSQEMFGDEFCEALAKQCPLLETLHIWEPAERFQEMSPPIRGFTDAALKALGRMQHLEYAELKAINCTGDGLFDLLNSVSEDSPNLRTFEITVGSMSPFQRTFSDTATTLLRRFLDSNAPPCLKTKFALRLKNGNISECATAWSRTYLADLRKLINDVNDRHPDIEVRVIMNGYDGAIFSQFFELGLFTKATTPSVFFGWDEAKGADNTYINRGGSVEDREFFYGMSASDEYMMATGRIPIDYEPPWDFDGLHGGYGEYDDFSDEYDEYGYDDDEGDDDDEGPI